MKDEQLWVAVADLHGHPQHLSALVDYLERRHSGAYRLALLGDYLDNGPDIPGLIELLITLRKRLGERFVAIMGNHDLACLRALGLERYQPDPLWYAQWCDRYFSWTEGTPQGYGATTLEELAERMPAEHLQFLRSLPWYFDTGRYFFVHAGLERGPLGPQRERLHRKELPVVPHFMPSWLQDKTLATVSDAGWGRLVVSGHTRAPGRGSGSAPHFVGPNRLCVSAEVDTSEVLYAVMLPEGRVLRIADGGLTLGEGLKLTLDETEVPS